MIKITGIYGDTDNLPLPCITCLLVLHRAVRCPYLIRDLQQGSSVSVELTCPLQPRYSWSTSTPALHLSAIPHGATDPLNLLFSYPLTQVPTLLPSWFSALGRGGVSGQRAASLIGRSLISGAVPQMEGSRLTGVSWSPPSPSLQDEPTVHSALSEAQDPVSLEKAAAVSDSSPVVTNQGDGAGCSVGNDIKTETLEDD